MTATYDGILLVNPAGVDGRIWRWVRELLPPNLAVVSADPLPDDGPVDIKDAAADLCRQVEDAGLRRPLGVGISLGGMILQHAAGLQPDLWAGLVLGDTNYHQPPDRRQVIMERASSMVTIDEDEYVHQTLERWFSAKFAETHPHIVGEVEQMLRQAPRRARLRDWMLVSQVDAREAHTVMRMPVRLLVGTQDSSTPPTLHHGIAERLPSSTVHEIEGAGHMSCVERPDVWAFHMLAAVADGPQSSSNRRSSR